MNEQPVRLLSSEEVAKRLRVSVRTLWRLVASKQFPQPIRFNRKLVRWTSRSLDDWLASAERLIVPHHKKAS